MGDRAGEALLLDGDYDSALQIAKELSRDLGLTVVGAGTTRFSRLLYSRYCDESVVLPNPGDDGYEGALLALLRDRRPDVVVPVGYQSTAALDAIRGRVPDEVALPIPSSDALETAVDKRETATLASGLGISVPTDVTDAVEALDEGDRERPESGELPFPLFLKPARETGETLSAKVASPDEFWQAYDPVERELEGSDVLVQESMEGDGRTYACGCLFVDGEAKLTFGHAELRSVPRRGGSGTRLRTFRDPRLESMSTELLRSLEWHGVALVEYRRTEEGYVLMEINPKFWASYALASQCGYRFASALVAETLGRRASFDPVKPPARRQRVFPLREAVYCLRNRDEESLFEGAAAMLWPPACPDVNVEDLPAWLVPPRSFVRNSSRLRTALDGADRLLGGSPPAEWSARSLDESETQDAPEARPGP